MFVIIEIVLCFTGRKIVLGWLAKACCQAGTDPNSSK
jgi:hypothetical protein